MAVHLKDLVGPHLVEAWWAGTRARLHHPVCSEICLDGGVMWEEDRCTIIRRWRARRGEQLKVVLLRMDEVTYKFEEEAIATGDPKDRSTILGPITAMATKDWIWDYQFDAAAGGPLMIEVRVHGHGCDEEILYGTSEITGLCLFHIGTEYDPAPFDYPSYAFDVKCDPLGYTPKWLEVVDPDPPVEMRAKRSQVVRTPKATQYRGKTKQGAQTPVGSVRPSAERRRIEKAERIQQWKRERGE